MSQRKIILVTGASRGLGFALAESMGALGHHIIALARTQGGLTALDDAIQAAGGPQATLVPCDMSDHHDQLDALGAHVYERFGKLDGLVLNAAHLGELAPAAQTTPKEWHTCMMVNATANFRLLRSLAPLLQQAAGSFVLGITCQSLMSHTAYWSAYRASKMAFECLLQSFAAEQPTGGGINVRLNDPGPMATKLHAAAYPGHDPAQLPNARDAAQKIITQLF
ncbi:MAG: SDR family NAD(P)-dependent oxidoreductase [Alphaproteobacteria bacterium]|nr:SDR family NAD(P)-dependent oxidoreductase [Alphaproteobacteria bacterium]NDC56113.1 SDR family NAD(P)-dependent oxidoreductase [Alphaproteobacteria bacterium]